MDPNEIKPDPNAPAPHVAPPAAPKPADPAPPKPEPFAVFPDAASFQDRVDREARKRLEQLAGVKDPEELKARLAKAEQLEKEAEEARKASLSEAERMKLELEEARAAAAAAKAEATAAAQARANVEAMAREGVTNTAYGHFLLDQARREAGTGPFDEKAKLVELLAMPEHAAALRPAKAGGAPETRPANTGAGGPDPKPAPAGGAPDAPPDVMKMSREEFAAYKASKGIYT